MRQLSIWSLATESRTSLRSSSFCFRESTSWSLVRRIRPDRKSENTCKCFESRTMPLNPDQFAKIAESLRQYRRAEMADFQADVGGNPVEILYVDPLESDAVLKTVLQNNTTFLVGRKGTGKST